MHCVYCALFDHNLFHGGYSNVFVHYIYSRDDDITTILHRVNDEVSQKEGRGQCGAAKQMPEVRFTLRKTLVLSPPEA